MRNIHLRATHAIMFILMGVFCVVVAHLIYFSTNKDMSLYWAIGVFFIGPWVFKSIYDESKFISDSAGKLDLFFHYSFGFIWLLVFALAWIISYIPLAPLYVLYWLGVVLGKGSKKYL